MMTCPKCHTGVPEGMRFCLQCGASVAPAPSPAAPYAGADPPVPAAPMAPPAPYTAPARPAPFKAPPPPPGTTTVPLKIAPTPVMAPRGGAGAQYGRPSLGDQVEEIDDEALKKSFERRLVPPGAVVCRFCKGPLDLAGDFCEQCGAPVTEAAPPGTLLPKPPPAAAPAPPPSMPAQAAPPPRPPAASTATPYPSAAPPTPPGPAPRTEATRSTTPTRTPAPVAPPPPPTPTEEEEKSGLMGRFKGLFKKS